MNINESYKKLGIEILYNGMDRQSRNGQTRSLFGTTIKYDMSTYGFPLLSMRKINYKAAFAELECFLKDYDTLSDFEEAGCPYWKLWADKDGKLKLDYPPREQMDYVIDTLKKDNTSRRAIIDLWNPENRDKLSLDPCHTQYQFSIRLDKLHMIWTQRSVDYAIGLPFDFVLAGAYMLIMCRELDVYPGTITFQMGDTHLYIEHIEQFKKMMLRNTDALKIDAFSYDGYKDFNSSSISIYDYNPQSKIDFLLKK